MSHHLKKNHITTNWSGGETTELYIYPENAQYKTGNYLFRLSTATVEVEESTFTPLWGVDRTLMVLEGEMKLVHEGYHEALLGPLYSDQFKGDWITRSEGKCVDFNLMCKGETKGEVKGYNLSEGENLSLDLNGRMNFIFVYQGMIEIDGIAVEEGNLSILDTNSNSASILANEKSVFIEVSVVF
ncbi:MAG: HutD family protein [Cytophagia bacterium]|nr:HutD family protein [Cytophagia bacterium]